MGQERAPRNRALFREVNEQTRRLTAGFGERSLIGFLCECVDGGCGAELELSAAEYDAVRTVEGRFVVVPTHVMPGEEVAVEQNDRFWVVEVQGALPYVPEASSVPGAASSSRLVDDLAGRLAPEDAGRRRGRR